jgi:cell division protein FtsW (lipid II flippase)
VSARNRELLALVPVAALVTAGFTAVFIVDKNQISNVSLIYGGYFLAVCLVVHLFIRARLPYADPYLFPLCALLAAIGLVILFRINDSLALKQASYFVVGAALLALTIILLREYRLLEQYRYLIALTGMALLLAPRLPGIGSQVNGAYLGIKAGPISFQPAEVAKICIVIFLASYLHERKEMLTVGARRIMGLTIPPLKHFGPLLVVWGAAMVLLFIIRDIGSSLMFFGAFLALLYVATNRFSYVLVGALLFLVGTYFVSHSVSHVQDRVDIWLHTFQANPCHLTHAQLRFSDCGLGQVRQSLYAQADGGLFGAGLGSSLLKLPGIFASSSCHQPFPDCNSILPAPHTDEIYAVIVSELGLFGGVGVIVIYALIAARGFKTAVMVPDGFSKLLAAGLTAVFALQAFVIIGGVVKLIPLTGVTLPFISSGGSSVIVNMVLLALLLQISDRARRPAPVGEPGPAPPPDFDVAYP